MASQKTVEMKPTPHPLSMDSSGRRDFARGTEELVPGLLKSDSLLGGHSYRGKDSEDKSNPWDAKDS